MLFKKICNDTIQKLYCTIHKKNVKHDIYNVTQHIFELATKKACSRSLAVAMVVIAILLAIIAIITIFFNNEYGTYLVAVASIILASGVFILQNSNIIVQNFESTFFKFIDYHRKNIDEFNIQDEHGNQHSGRHIFKILINEFNYIANIIHSSSTIRERELVNISYIYLLLGYESGENYITKNCILVEAENYVQYIPELILHTDYTALAFGRDDVLGHYFRNLYYAAKFVDDHNLLTSAEKHKYMKILRSQLSKEELILLFYNSLSHIGANWENKAGGSELITKYELLKNISLDTPWAIAPNYYSMSYEFNKEA